MTRIICAEDCGNAPKRILLKKLLTALARGDNAFILKNVSDDVTWHRPGQSSLLGKAAVAKALERMKRQPMAEMTIETIVTHGPTGAANGVMIFNSGKSVAFSHVYRFSSAKGARIKELTEYLIPT